MFNPRKSQWTMKGYWKNCVQVKPVNYAAGAYSISVSTYQKYVTKLPLIFIDILQFCQTTWNFWFYVYIHTISNPIITSIHSYSIQSPHYYNFDWNSVLEKRKKENRRQGKTNRYTSTVKIIKGANGKR